MPFETAQMEDGIIVPFEMAQIPNVLFATGWKKCSVKGNG